MKRHVLIDVVVVFAVATLAGAANAQDHYQVTMTGTVTKVNDPGNDLVIEVNDTWTVVYLFDPHAQDDTPIDPFRGEYDAIASMSLAIGPCIFADFPLDPLLVVYNSIDFGDWYNIVADTPLDPISPCPFLDMPLDPVHLSLSLYLQDSTGEVWSSDALPTMLDLGDFDVRDFSLTLPELGVEIRGGIASIEVEPVGAPIPTVSAWGLAVLALALLVGAKVYFNRRRAMQM